MRIRIDVPQGIHEIGGRNNQEDAICPAVGKATSDERVFVLCDGMGGHEQGEVASQTVCTTIYEYMTAHWPKGNKVDDCLVTDAIQAAYTALDAKDSDAAKKMGTTLTLVVLHEGGCIAAHIGDSRIYHLRTEERRLLYRSRDHSLVTDLYQAGEISYEEMGTSPQKNIITKAMQPGEDNRVRPDIVHIGNLRPGDYLFLCSDGMMEKMDDSKLLEILCAKVGDSEKRRQLIEATAGNSDNHSAHLIHIRKVVMDENEAVVDEEGTTRSNFLNIHPDIVEAEEVEMDDQEETKKDRRWFWLLLLAAILALAFYAWVSQGDDNNNGQRQIGQQEAPIKSIQSPSQKAKQLKNSSEMDMDEISPYKSDKNE